MRRISVCQVALFAAAITGGAASARAQEPTLVFRERVDLFVVRVQVVAGRDAALPVLDVSHFSLRIGRRTPPIHLVEQVPAPADVDSASGPYTFFRPVRDRPSAIYLLGTDPDAADCRQTPRISVTLRDLRIRAWAWTPKAGCEPPGSRILRR